MHETSAQGWCTGKTQRDGVGREVGGGIGMGNTCKSMADYVNVWQKPLQYCKVISLQLIKINEKKFNEHHTHSSLLQHTKSLAGFQRPVIQKCVFLSIKLILIMERWSDRQHLPFQSFLGTFLSGIVR